MDAEIAWNNRADYFGASFALIIDNIYRPFELILCLISFIMVIIYHFKKAKLLVLFYKIPTERTYLLPPFIIGTFLELCIAGLNVPPWIDIGVQDCDQSYNTVLPF